MFRWNDITGYYREKWKAESTISIPNISLELDHYAYIHLGSELEMYKIMDTNFVRYIEERGDIQRLKNIDIPIEG